MNYQLYKSTAIDSFSSRPLFPDIKHWTDHVGLHPDELSPGSLSFTAALRIRLQEVQHASDGHQSEGDRSEEKQVRRIHALVGVNEHGQ